jgi:hypothetical protein
VIVNQVVLPNGVKSSQFLCAVGELSVLLKSAGDSSSLLQTRQETLDLGEGRVNPTVALQFQTE